MGSFYDRTQGNVQPTQVPVFTNVNFLHDWKHQTLQLPVETPVDDGLSFWQRRAIDLRIATMAPPIKQAPYWNTTMVTAWVAVIVAIFTILGAIGALYVYTDSVAEQRGIEKGRMAAEREQQQREMEALRKQLLIHDEKLKQEGK